MRKALPIIFLVYLFALALLANEQSTIPEKVEGLSSNPTNDQDAATLAYMEGKIANGDGIIPLEHSIDIVSPDGWAGGHANQNSYRWQSLTSIRLSTKVYQALCYWNSDGYLVIGKRVLDGEWTLYTYDGMKGRPLINVGTIDNHDTCVIGIDNQGYIHVSYGMHVSALNYRKSNLPISTWTGTLTDNLTMLGTNESSVTYPSFFNDATYLYFAFRNGVSGDGDLFIYRYNHNSATWSGITGTMDGLVIDGKNSSPDQNPYWCLPVFDDDFGSGGFMHLAWVWRETTDSTTTHDYSYVRWDGSTFTKSSGDAQTIPITLANSEIFDPIPVNNGLLAFNGIYSDSNRHPHVVYPKLGADGYEHLYHAWHNGANWVIQQLSTTPRPLEDANAGSTYLEPIVAIDRVTNVAYVFYSDNFDAEGIILLQSAANDFTTWTKLIIYPRDVGWTSPQIDWAEWGRETIFNFLICPWDETWTSSRDTQPIFVYKWDPINP
jgi:hypothetical protein